MLGFWEYLCVNEALATLLSPIQNQQGVQWSGPLQNNGADHIATINVGGVTQQVKFEGREISHLFGGQPAYGYMIDFKPVGQADYARTGAGKPIETIRAVGAVIKEFIDTVQPEMIGWNPLDAKLKAIYERMANQFLVGSYVRLSPTSQAWVKKDLIRHLPVHMQQAIAA